MTQQREVAADIGYIFALFFNFHEGNWSRGMILA
jgi:hypothetical protein